MTFADILIDGHRETWPVRNKRFRGWLRRCHYQTTGGAASAYNRRYMDICPQGPQFAREFVNEADRHRFIVGRRPTKVDADITALGPPELLESLPGTPRPTPVLLGRSQQAHQHADASGWGQCLS